MLRRVIIGILINSAALWFADAILGGMWFTENSDLLIAAIVFGLLNTFLKPFLMILTLPVTVLTLGIFTLVINGIIVEITAHLLDGFYLESFWTAILAAILISIVSMALNSLLEEKK